MAQVVSGTLKVDPFNLQAASNNLSSLSTTAVDPVASALHGIRLGAAIGDRHVTVAAQNSITSILENVQRLSQNLLSVSNGLVDAINVYDGTDKAVSGVDTGSAR